MAPSYRSPASAPPFDCNDFPMYAGLEGEPLTPPPPYAAQDLPLTAPYLNHNHQECVHTTRLCEERYAHLEALVANLERCQCRCGQSTWSRLTKSFFGSLRTQAASLKSRTRSQKSTRSEPKASRISPYKRHSSGRTRHPTTPPNDEPTELDSSAFTPELSGTSFLSQETQVGVRSTSFSDPQGLGYAHARHELADSSPPSEPHLAFGRSQTQPPSFGRPVALASAPNFHMMAQYSGQAPTPPRTNPSLATSTVSHQGSGSFATPQTSMSSAASALGPDGMSAINTGFPSFSTETTSSPQEYEPGNMSWNASQPTPQHPGNYTAELPAEIPDSGLGTPERGQPRAYDPVAEMEDLVPGSFMSPVISLPPSQPMPPREMPGDPRMEPAVSGWEYSPTMTTASHLPMIPNPSYDQCYRPRAPASHFGPQPFMPQGRGIFDLYSADTGNIHNFLTPNRYSYGQVAPTPEQFDTHPTRSPQTHNAPVPQPPSTPIRPHTYPLYQHQVQHSQHSQHPQHPQDHPQNHPQDHPQTQQQHPLDSEPPLHCPHCDFTTVGPHPNYKMAKHERTKKHRENTGQAPGPQFPCAWCTTSFTGGDNLREHVKKKHAGVADGGGGGGGGGEGGMGGGESGEGGWRRRGGGGGGGGGGRGKRGGGRRRKTPGGGVGAGADGDGGRGAGL
ncbi:predicted protein [Chaetomium globosum CBS 148.51]|uniref:C2H2-type domain-containing protein n=1 Tax=Chaetomium globosum (strain ATCC 6205 / CBS 148.51 / DSM 1962 / NBRC 6347 / NRRL 1970) TaxID=306901 RepID=Q2GWN7_CHAGB|nr:uncharacterized protein CHGG_07617 [Chaetomium globosum CBS 148.51]EAQ86364.1 predicted protein [Chaetomium globosum CBS 148.51]